MEHISFPNSVILEFFYENLYTSKSIEEYTYQTIYMLLIAPNWMKIYKKKTYVNCSLSFITFLSKKRDTIDSNSIFRVD